MKKNHTPAQPPHGPLDHIPAFNKANPQPPQGAPNSPTPQNPYQAQPTAQPSPYQAQPHAQAQPASHQAQPQGHVYNSVNPQSGAYQGRRYQEYAAPMTAAQVAQTQKNRGRKAKRRKRPVSKKARAINICLDILIIAALLGSLYYFLRPMYNNYMNDQKTRELIRASAMGQADAETGKIGIWIDPKANPVSGEGGYDTPQGVISRQEALVSHSDGKVFVEYIAQMGIDSIDLNMPIVWGCDYPQLQVGLGWYQNSGKIGEDGNAVILGHRMLEYGRHFNRLNEVKEGDIITISTKEKNYSYQVTRNFVVPVNQMFDYFDAQPGEKEITLVTCTNQGDTRILVQANLVKETDKRTTTSWSIQ